MNSGGPTLGGQVQLIADNKGNRGVAISAIPLTGGGTPSISVAGSYSTTNANSIYDLRGWGTNSGGSVNAMIVPIGAGGDYNEGKGYSGHTITVGGKVSPLPVEIHTNQSHTWVIPFPVYEKVTRIKSFFSKMFE